MCPLGRPMTDSATLMTNWSSYIDPLSAAHDPALRVHMCGAMGLINHPMWSSKCALLGDRRQCASPLHHELRFLGPSDSRRIYWHHEVQGGSS
ncbi:unnamed protein product [Nezara viridula]|uniref:Uncharacterized protein n=1 Tax=Nezara viridula TaxID=85310 RepID=A0A9P0HJB1_NEZVI|nr:unnamed protein product [Nezara viridula]